MLEEQREKKFDFHARVIQKAFKKYFNQLYFLRQKEEASDLFFQKKERRKHSLNRVFYADYIGLDDKPGNVYVCTLESLINIHGCLTLKGFFFHSKTVSDPRHLAKKILSKVGLLLDSYPFNIFKDLLDFFNVKKLFTSLFHYHRY